MKVVNLHPGYDAWIRSIKERVQRARFKALMMANAEQILLYWDVGHEILEKQDAEGWGSKIVERMSKDLKSAFPDMKGWSRSNLMYMRQFAEAWRRDEIVQAPLGQLPWYHHLTLLEHLKSRGDRIAYAALAVENGWSRNVMVHQIDLKMESRLFFDFVESNAASAGVSFSTMRQIFGYDDDYNRYTNLSYLKNDMSYYVEYVADLFEDWSHVSGGPYGFEWVIRRVFPVRV